MSKSYWQSMSIRTARDQEACKAWFSPVCDDDMKVERADVLCDEATDREKKARAVMVAPDGKRFQFERTLGGRNFSISRTAIPDDLSIAMRKTEARS